MEQFPNQAAKHVNFYVFAVTVFLAVRAYSLTFYCVHGNNVNIQGEVNGTIKTLVNGQSHYGDNMNCTWTLDAGAGNRVRLKTLTFDLQYTPSYVSCYGNDYLQIHNGDTQQSAILGSFCGRNNPYEVVSQGRYLYFTFWTNSKNFYNHAGITMVFQVFADDACPPEWSLLHSDKTCVKLMLNPNTGADWSDSQKYCGYSQSNLATYATQSVFDFVQANLSRSGTSHAWVGLNDVLKEGDYKWLGGSTPSSSIRTKFDPYISNTLADCVIHNFVTETLATKQCDRDSYHFLCLQNQDGSTEVYKTPEAPTETTRKRYSPETQAWIVTVIAVICLFAILAVYLACRLRRRNSKHGSETYRSPHMDIQEEIGETLLTERGGARCHTQDYLVETPALQQVFVQPSRDGALQYTPPPTYSEVVTSG